MLRFEQAFREICSLADSKKISDRKRCIVKLRELYKSNAAIEELCNNSRNRDSGGTGWKAILHSVHNVLLYEAERSTSGDANRSFVSTSKLTSDKETQVKIDYAMTMVETVKRANSPEIHLDCNTLLPLILQIFSNQLYIVYQRSYLTILVKHVLCVKHYKTHISPVNWWELLKLTVKMYESEHPYIDKYFILKAISQIIQKGSTQSHLALKLKKIFPFLVKVFNDAKSDPRKLSDVTFKLANIVCQQVGAESRIALCDFGETVLPCAINLNGNYEKYDWMLLMVQAHHPGGVTKYNDGAYAFNFEKWKEILPLIYRMVLKDSALESASNSFVQLASEVLWQLKDNYTYLDGDGPSDDVDYAHPSKRRRTAIGIQGMIDTLTTIPLEESLVSIEILIALITRHSVLIKISHVLPLMEFLVAHLSTCQNENVLNHLWDLARALLKFESKFANDLTENDAIKSGWDKIWSIALTSASTNKHAERVHRLLQSFISHKKSVDTNAILNLYLKNNCTWSKASIRTLLVFCKHNIIQNDTGPYTNDYGPTSSNNSPVKIRLLQWILAVPPETWNAQIPIEDVCELLVGLTLRSWYDIDKDVTNICHQSNVDTQDIEATTVKRCHVTNFEDACLMTAFKGSLYNKTDIKTSPHCKQTRGCVLHINENFDFLIKNLIEKNAAISDKEPADSLIVQTAVVARIFSNFMYLKISHEKVENLLSHIIEQSLEEISLSVEEIVQSKKKRKRNHLMNVLEALHLLYNGPYYYHVAELIRSSTGTDMLKHILLLTNVDNLHNIDGELRNNDGSTSITYIKNINHLSHTRGISKQNEEFLKADIPSNVDTIRLKASAVLAAFCAMLNSENPTHVQENLLITILNPNSYDLSEICDFKMAVTILESLMERKFSSFPEKVITDTLKMLQQLSRYWHKNNEAARIIINILSKLLPVVAYAGTAIQKQNILRILSQFHKLLQGNEYGPATCIAFIQCLETIAEIDPSFTWTKWEADDGSTPAIPVMNELLVYVKSPFHVVRLKVIDCLQILFSSEDVSLEWLKEFFNKLRTAITELFRVDGEVKERVKEDERTNRIASALHLMVIVISCSALFRSRALLSVFQLTVDKNINPDIVKRALERVNASLQIKDIDYLVESNLYYLLTHWLENGYSIQKFPIILAGCNSEQEFYNKYMRIIAFVVIQRGNIEEISELCNKFGMSVKNVIEDCFPRLISWLLPYISADQQSSSNDLVNAATIQRANSVYIQLNNNLKQFETVQKVSVLVKNNLENVIVTVISRLHDEEHSMQFLNIPINYPSCDPPEFKHCDIQRSFKFLENNIIGTKSSLLHFLATEKRGVLQKVLMKLKCRMYEEKSVELKLKALHHYVYFVMMIMEEINNNYFDDMSAYVVRDVCYTLMNLLKESSVPISKAACDYFYHLLRRMLPKRCAEVKQNLRLIVSSMIPIVKSGKTRHAIDVITFLLVEQSDLLAEAIERLDSFPPDKEFRQVREKHFRLRNKNGQRQTLDDEIRHFLSTRRENMENCSITELDYLKEQLSTKKQELQEMYRSLGLMKRFSEDCASSVLHQLTCALVKLTISSDADFSLRAAECLGELGPADLTTMILQPEKEHSRQFLEPMQTFTYRILVLLSNLLIHPDVCVFTASSEALYIITASFWGTQIVSNRNLKDLKRNIELSEECLRIEYIKPFVGKSSQQKNVNTIDVKKFEEFVNDNVDLWTGKVNDSHNNWITNIVCQILDCFNGSYMKHLIPVCRVNVSFCEKILPWIIYLVIHFEKNLDIMLYAGINRFFRCHYAESSEKNKNNSLSGAEHRNICFNHKSVQCMLNVVEFIRSQSVEKFKIELEYLHIAKAAQYCSAYFTSVLYAELWCECLRRTLQTSDHLLSIDYIYESTDEIGKVLQDILREAFIKIGDPDAIYGCGASYYQDSSERIQHYVQLRKWDKVLLAHDIEMSLGNKTASKGLLDALYQSGLQYLLGAFVRTIDKTEDEKDDTYRYECAWRLSDWNIPDTQQMMNWKDVDFQTILSTHHPLFHYRALKFYHESDTDRLKTALDSARISVIKTLRNISLESCKAVYPALSQLQMLREIEEVYFAEPDTYNSMIEKWKHQDAIGVNDFEYIEPVLSQRAILLQATGKVESKVIKSALVDTYLQITELSKKYGYFQMAARALGSLAKQVGTLTDEERNNLQYQEAKLAWERGDHELGRHLLRNLIVNCTSNVIHSEALTTYGNWMAESKSENPQKIIDKYYRASLANFESCDNTTERERQNFVYTQAVLAQFADVQFQQILSYMKSPQFESFRACVAYSEQTADKLSAYSKDADEKRAKFLNQKQCNNDMVELENIEKEKNMYLLLALEHYMRTLEQSEDHNLLVFRLVSLWLDNTHDNNLNELMQANLHKLPSYKFILLVPQLAPHISDTDDEFTTKIFNLLKRCAIEHPHHTIPVLLALMNSHKDHDFQNSRRSSAVKPEPRVLGATKLVQQLMSTPIKPIIEEMDKLANSLVMLANLEPPKAKSPRIPVPNNPLSIAKMKNFQHTLVPTMSIDIKPNKDYGGLVTIIKYDDSYELVGGINAPKKITCLCTDGQRRNQLVKGKDDLRQDAVMQQVFTVMNMLLRTSKEANKRKLNVRTYKVVPLTQRSGILEWCDETTPIFEILAGSNKKMGLHEKYYPKDYCIKKCRDIMAAVAKTSNVQKLAKYNLCCENLHPVFHYFFLENFLSPEIWFERRLSYVHSVATTSIIGYILGLGDRHLNNILLDKRTAEVIHIDFGIAFEQGKILPTPETVPFRLTRDMEVAMGVSGVEGVLRRSCEETMTVLRHHRSVIITLIQVLTYDPLFSWSITPAKAFSLQQRSTQGSSEGSEASGTKNKLAERALLRLDQKLRGTEEGSASSVAGQVEKLIQEARDPINLSRLFCGWQAYL